MLLLDESMSGWCPHTSQFGGLPNISLEPRKPVSLGTMFRNGVECVTGIVIHQDVVQPPEVEAQKEFYGSISRLPTKEDIGATTATVLRQVKGAGVPEGGWVGGDAWFGSVMTCVEVMKTFGVHSTWIIKNNRNLYPYKALRAILKARFGDRPAGHWVVMKTVIAEVPMFAIAYAWSQSGVSYFLSTCGTTNPSPHKYETSFEDDFGVTQYRQVERPCISHFLYDFLPLIDEHNKQRQSILGLERCWLTKDCWFRLVTTVVGMSVVDMHRWHRNKITGGNAVEPREGTYAEDLVVREFADLLTAKLATNKRNRREVARTIRRDGTEGLRRYAPDGHSTRNPTHNDLIKGRSTGAAKRLICFMCRRYGNKDGGNHQTRTSWVCNRCNMPLCKVDRKQPGRIPCLHEHWRTDDPFFGCTNSYQMGQAVPKERWIPYEDWCKEVNVEEEEDLGEAYNLEEVQNNLEDNQNQGEGVEGPSSEEEECALGEPSQQESV